MDDIKNLIISSPVRKNLNMDIPFRKLVKENLDEIISNFNLIQKRKNDPLNIVIMGEVKSGKSSFVNAILSEEVSEVDVLEATSSIIEISYGDESKRENIDGIDKISLNKELLKRVNIVDTPGLKSVTIKNEQKTINYIQNADLILFVLDATHLGQEDIEEMLDLISSYKKPIVGIVNKSDLLEDDKSQVMNYIKDEYGIYIEDFFMTSAYLEYQDRKSKEASVGTADLVISEYDELRENFKNLYRYIDKVCKNCEEIKFSSVNASLEGIIHKEIIYHHDYLKSIKMLIDELDNYNDLLYNKLGYVEEKMNFEIEDWLNRTFLSDEISKLNDNIEASKLYINEKYINDTINKKKTILDELYIKEWRESLKEVDDEIDKKLKKYIDNCQNTNEILYTPKIKIYDPKINLNDMLSTLGTGAILGATSGSIVSIYAAGIGSSAASLTIGNALLAYCPPLLLAGTITGGIGKLIYDKVKMDEKNNDLIVEINRFIDQLKANLSNDLKKGYKESSEKIVKNSKDKFKLNRGICIDIDKLVVLCEETEEYINSLKKYMSEL